MVTPVGRRAALIVRARKSAQDFLKNSSESLGLHKKCRSKRAAFLI